MPSGRVGPGQVGSTTGSVGAALLCDANNANCFVWRQTTTGNFGFLGNTTSSE